jgi:enoyl-[acyl-carrier protein] reductase III
MLTLITGGSRGIGRATAVRLAKGGGHTIFVNYLQNETAAAETRRLVEAEGSRCILCPANVSNPDEIDRLFEQIRGHTDHLDGFVHGAALNAFKPLSAVKPNQWDLTMNIDARGFLLCAQQTASLMTKGGRMVAVSSLGATRVLPNYGAQGPAKAALEAVVRSLAVEFAPRSINVNCVAGGLVETDSIHKFPNADQLMHSAIEHTPCGRIGTVEDMAGAIAFLLSAEAAWICGHTLIVDGGMSLS